MEQTKNTTRAPGVRPGTLIVKQQGRTGGISWTRAWRVQIENGRVSEIIEGLGGPGGWNGVYIDPDRGPVGQEAPRGYLTDPTWREAE